MGEERRRERGRSDGLRDCVYVGVGVGVRVCACDDAGHEGYDEICNALLTPSLPQPVKFLG